MVSYPAHGLLIQLVNPCNQRVEIALCNCRQKLIPFCWLTFCFLLIYSWRKKIFGHVMIRLFLGSLFCTYVSWTCVLYSGIFWRKDHSNHRTFQGIRRARHIKFHAPVVCVTDPSLLECPCLHECNFISPKLQLWEVKYMLNRRNSLSFIGF